MADQARKLLPRFTLIVLPPESQTSAISSEPSSSTAFSSWLYMPIQAPSQQVQHVACHAPGPCLGDCELPFWTSRHNHLSVSIRIKFSAIDEKRGLPVAPSFGPTRLLAWTSA
ncbi:hypothetical protein CC2G_011285 [Coprinopsis cinerea AmutBmut pab1-1]|nr:hypothetical protein CC2G_011285 [Coprinopsis cinerea AmutBmut pab1-1]